MASSDETPLSEVAANIATAAREEAAISEQILEESKGDNPKIESVLSHARCIADASDFLRDQLSALGEKDELALKSEDEEFWKLLRTLMELWLHNTKKTVEKMKRDDARQDSLTGRVAQHFRVKVEGDLAGVHGPLTWSGATLQDLQMVTSLLNVHRETVRPSSADSSATRQFLIRDLEWKARTLHAKYTRQRKELRQTPEWGNWQTRLAEVALRLVERERRESLIEQC